MSDCIKRIYIIEYKALESKGLAVVMATNSEEAAQLFKTSSNFNGIQYAINITRIEEVNFGIEPGLLVETYM